jgi:hypothetical protein
MTNTKDLYAAAAFGFFLNRLEGNFTTIDDEEVIKRAATYAKKAAEIAMDVINPRLIPINHVAIDDNPNSTFVKIIPEKTPSMRGKWKRTLKEQ